ncbi:hypothetical protein F6B50_05090 [Salmonella enterica]|nr:hypothetical protein [Salmonella enterica]EDC7603800.1 hypothetical protein [Salmonella enterica subsp. enterica serovar Newport]ECX3815162.1 hypothetical protein [Salmonella enterica]ECY2495395.1 hypothetical protein [Salmonella enterica]ECY2520702.1 hypothetical protein [Salmonella enterica]
MNGRVGSDGIYWQQPRTFVSLVQELRRYHPLLWFRPGEGVSLSAENAVKQWKSCQIHSAEGRILAHQIGNPNQWLLSQHYVNPDRYQDGEELPGCQELTEDFFHTSAGCIFFSNIDCDAGDT